MVRTSACSIVKGMVVTGLATHRDTDDQALPAAVHLTGPDARAVIETAVRALGGGLHGCRQAYVQYRPGSDLVVRYEALVSWGSRAPVGETLLAATTQNGPPPGTLPIVAEADGRSLEVGVWRWPFDPRLTALTAMVTADSAAERLAHLVRPPLSLEVVAYRPTERCVVRVTGACGTVIYVKVVDPATAGAVIDRHRRLLAAGLPVPEIIGGDAEAGWLAMAELPGDTLRLRLKAQQPGWPPAEEYLELVQRLRNVELTDMAPVAPRTVGRARTCRDARRRDSRTASPSGATHHDARRCSHGRRRSDRADGARRSPRSPGHRRRRSYHRASRHRRRRLRRSARRLGDRARPSSVPRADHHRTPPPRARCDVTPTGSVRDSSAGLATSRLPNSTQ